MIVIRSGRKDAMGKHRCADEAPTDEREDGENKPNDDLQKVELGRLRLLWEQEESHVDDRGRRLNLGRMDEYDDDDDDGE
mgnify:CR=1 FL=1